MFTNALQEATDIHAAPLDKAAFALAQRIEGDILGAADPADTAFGSETLLISRYQTSRKIVRQALRILESRSLGRVRRGAGGGLHLQAPGHDDVARLLAIHLVASGVNGEDVAHARAILMPMLGNYADDTAQWSDQLFDALQRQFEPTPEARTTMAENRALFIAQRVIIDCVRPGDDGIEQRLGRIEDLQERYFSDRRVVLQALRILEDLELVTVQRGRHGGLVARRPSPGAIARATFSYFVLSGMSGEMSGNIIWAINKINTAHAAMDLSKPTADALAQVMATLPAHHGTRDDFSPQIKMWRVLADAAQNRVLHALARCLFYFQIQSGVMRTDTQGPMQSETVLTLTRRICTAVSNGHALAALDAVTRLEQVSRA